MAYSRSDVPIRFGLYALGTLLVLASAAGAQPAAPLPPALQVTVSGDTVSLIWSPGAGSHGSQIEAGSRPGLSDLLVMRFGAGVTLREGQGYTWWFLHVAPGIYYVRVRNATPDYSFVSAPSNEVIVIVGPTGCAIPDPPEGWRARTRDTEVDLEWFPAASGPPHRRSCSKSGPLWV